MVAIGHGPVEQIEVEAGQAQIRQGALQGWAHVFGGVAVVPELGGDPDLVALEPPSGEGLLEACADLGLVSIDRGAIKVAVAQLQGRRHGASHLAAGRLPGAKSQGWHAVAIGKTQA